MLYLKFPGVHYPPSNRIRIRQHVETWIPGMRSAKVMDVDESISGNGRQARFVLKPFFQIQNGRFRSVKNDSNKKADPGGQHDD